MAAPTLQAEGSIAATTSASVSPTIPAHVADDILVAVVVEWTPNTAGVAVGPSEGSGTWTKFLENGIANDGGVTFWWKRATGSGTTVTFTHGDDTGADTNFSALVYVIRGCITSGNPWDDAQVSAAHTTANQSSPAFTVSGSERLAATFFGMTDNLSMAPGAGWTGGTLSTTGTGTDAGITIGTKASVSSNQSATTSSTAAPAAGCYVIAGVSFKPPAAASSSDVPALHLARRTPRRRVIHRY